MAKYSQTNIALAYEQQGFFEQAQGAYELTTNKMRADYATTPAPASLQQVRPGGPSAVAAGGHAVFS